MEAASEFAQLQLRLVDQFQWRYELIRPLVLFEERPASPHAIRQRAHDTATHPETVRKFTRRFEHQGLLALLPEAVEIVPKGPTPRVPPEVIAEIGHLKSLYDGFQYQELVRIVLCKHQYRMTDKTAKRLWQQSPPAPQGALPLGDYHSYPERSEARLEVLKLYVQGWNKLSISRVLPVSRPTVDRWIRRFEDEQLAGLVDRPRGLQAPRKVWFPVMVASYHLQKGVFILQRHRRPWFSIPLLSPVWSAVFSSRNQFQVGTSRRHLGEFGLVIALILLGFMERPIRIEIAIDHQRSEFENGFASFQSPPGPRDLHTIFHQITASPFDHPRGDGIPLGQVVWIVEVRDVIGQVGRALIDRFTLFWAQSLHGRPAT
jgi:hypothetical protein